VRDTGPTFVITNDDKLVAVDFNFNGWGGRQEHAADAQVAGRIAQLAGAQLQETTLVLEGGGIEVDGDGTALVTESCILNDNRNPGVSKAEMESQLGPLLGVEKFIWLPGLRGHDITDGHIDFYARFTSPGHIIAALDSDPESPDYNITRTHLDLLRDATDAKGRSLKIQTLRTPETIRPDFASDDFAAGFIGYYVCNDAVIIQEFGDHAADTAAREIIQSAYPDREVIALNMDALATGGGSIHCVTQQQPSLNSAH
jgi:agmatine deiminase